MNLNNHKLILTILSAFCFVLIFISALKNPIFTPLRTAVGYVLLPVQMGVNKGGGAIYNYMEENAKLRMTYEENIELKKEIDRLTEENTILQENNMELDRLRDLYSLDKEYNMYDKVGARIIAKTDGNWFRVFRIDKGIKDGIKVDMNVMAQGGLVGIVTDVGTSYSTVRSIIDDVSRVSAMNINTNDLCIVSGDLKLYEEGKLKLSDIKADADIKDGDKIVTSNISTKYLPGILIGYAENIELDSSKLTKSGFLIPAADFDTMSEVLVITDLKENFQE